ncbi:30S ribosome-binding factor RbfA [Candidatus Nitrosacidococcus sp. I8]|uniref:30S ribosome-binding factor RbfA n=1 Tax=Candidatus Nitrosacidococcus sp. I8 TaxID=2942908 RepID=UPI0022262006|nr:30S ribosome-binding factor RbfA [Candidatus Nitrosacidococcus sp. I8]CAH9017842.1 Ribosome-binding factor A [Candidatus Nitrosacidococcus sp. I8]
MNQNFPRTHRINELLKRELALLIQKNIKDPRIKLVTVSYVDISPDLKQAKVYITSMEQDKARINAQLNVLNKAGEFFKRNLYQRVDLRVVPNLKFLYDNSIEHGNYLRSLIDKVVKENHHLP